MIDFGYNNKKTNIKVNILLAAFLEINLYDNTDCYIMINNLLKIHIGICVYTHKVNDCLYYPIIVINSDNKSFEISLGNIYFDNNIKCFKAGFKIILAYICCLANDNKNSAYNILEHENLYMRAINKIIDKCEAFDINLKDKYNKYHATIDCYFPDLIESILI